jgi:3-hydroxy-9,10-secoandrosta-1,3,5(10)-triene-9,17-dione monooxygenase reductase component
MSPEEFKSALSRWVTGVAVITTRSRAGDIAGLTASSFTSVSLDPPLVLFCLAHSSTSKPAFETTDRFAINILGEGQQALSGGFAQPGGDKFAGVGWRPGLLGIPLLDGAVAHLECRIVQVHPGGDHTIMVGEVERIDVSDDKPLVYFRGAYRSI